MEDSIQKQNPRKKTQKKSLLFIEINIVILFIIFNSEIKPLYYNCNKLYF